MAKRKISAKDLLTDIRSGLDDDQIMEKYQLTPTQLENVFGKLVEADFITVVELHERARLSESQVTRAFVEAQRAIDELE